MSRRLIGFLRRSKILVLVSALILLSGVGTLIAQNPNSVSGMLDQVLARVISLQATTQGNVRATPPIFIGALSTDLQYCTAVNVSNATRQIEMNLIIGSGAIVQSASPTLGPGAAAIIGGITGSGYYCKFAVLDVGATKSDFRGALEVTAVGGPVHHIIAAE